MVTLARRLLKFFFFMLLLILVGRVMGEPYKWLNHDFVLNIASLIYGAGEIGAEAIDDAYFYINLLTAIVITTAIYLATMKLIRKIRRK